MRQRLTLLLTCSIRRRRWFRVKAPVTRRPPHRSGREGFPHPVPREPAACVTGSPHRRHPVWRLTGLSRARLDGVDAPGLGERQCLREGRDTLLPASGALVAASAPPGAPRPRGRLADPGAPCAMAPSTLAVVVAAPVRPAGPLRLWPWRLAVVTTPWPERWPTPAPSLPDRVALAAPVATACLGPRGGQAQHGAAPRAPCRVPATGGLLARPPRRRCGRHGPRAPGAALREDGPHPARGGCPRAAAEASSGHTRPNAPPLPPGRPVSATPGGHDLRPAPVGPEGRRAAARRGARGRGGPRSRCHHAGRPPRAAPPQDAALCAPRRETRPANAPGSMGDTPPDRRRASPGAGPRPTRRAPLVPRWLGTGALPHAGRTGLAIGRAERLQAQHHGPWDQRVRTAGLASGPLLPPCLGAPDPRAGRGPRPLGAPPLRPVPAVGRHGRSGRRGRHRVAPRGPRLAAQPSGCPQAVVGEHVQPVVAPQRGSAWGLVRQARAWPGDGGGAQRRSQRALPLA
jgi:hypothetical protein